MLGAAPTCKRRRGLTVRLVILAAALAAQLAYAANALAAQPKVEQNTGPTAVWGIALDGRQPDQPDLELLSQAKAAGLNAIVTDPKRWSPSRHTRLVELARQLGLLLIEPRRPVDGSADLDMTADACKAQRRSHQPCAVVATSASEANTFARRTNADYVVVRLDSPADLARVNARPSGPQVIGVLTVGTTPKLDASWDRAIGSAVDDKRSTIAVGLSGSFAAPAMQNYFTLLDKHNVTAQTFEARQGNGNGPDRLPPTTPLGGAVTNATTTSVNLSWIASTDNYGVAGYGVYVNGSLVGSTGATAFTVTGLVCGSTYTFGIDAYDKRRNRSVKLVFTGSTAGCPAPPPAPAPGPAPQPADTTPPTQPAAVTTTGVTTSSITLTWGASTDNVGVAGYEISKAGVVAGNTSTTSYLLAGLSCGTSYNLSVKAYDAAGNKSDAATTTVATSACAAPADTQAPTIPGNLHVTSTTVSSIAVAWDPSTDNVGVTGYGVYRDGTLAGSTNSSAYTISGLACGTVVILALDAYDAAANHSARATLTTSTSACPPAADSSAPTTPSSLHATGATPSSITIAWTASTDNVGVAGYTAYNGSSAAGTTTSTSYTVSGLQCGVTYNLSVDAFDAAGNRSSKATVSSTTNACAPPPPAADTQAPTTPTNLAVLGATTSSITVGWTASSDNVGVTGYGLYRGGSSTGSTTSTSTTFSGLACGSAYVLAIDAYDAAGNRSNQATITASASPCPPAADTQAPTMPGGLHVTGATGTSITVAWTASTDNVTVTGYGLYRAGSSTGSTASTSATFTGLVCGTTYAIGVDAYDAAGNRSTQATVSSPTSACPPPPPTSDTSPPTAPGSLAATGATTTSVSVSWSASTDNVGVTGYGLYRGGSSTGSTTTTNASFTGLTCGTAYTIAIDAFDAAGNRSSKSTITASTSACAPAADTQAPTVPGGVAATAATGSSITLGWTASTDNVGVTGYGLYRNGTSTGSTASTSASFSGLTCGTAYTLAVDAYDAAGNRSAKATITASTGPCPPPADTQAPTAPGGLHATGTTANSATVAWTASTDNVGVTGYTVYNGSSAAGNTASTSYTVSGLSCGTGYTVAVDAVDAAGNRSGKATVSVTTGACSAPPPPPTGSGVSLSPSGNDSTCARGDSSKPCATPAKAWSLAQAGDTISVADGNYTSGCSISGGKSSDVTFKGSINAKFICQLDFVAGYDFHGVVDGISMMQFHGGGNYVTVKNGAVTCQDQAPYTLYPPDNMCTSRISLNGDHYLFQNLTVGPTYSNDVCGSTPTTPNVNGLWGVSDVTFKNVTFVDARRGCDSVHTENMYVAAGNSSITWDGVTFYNGPKSGLHGQGGGPNSAELFITGAQSGFLIQNSIFWGQVASGFGVDGASDSAFTNTQFRNNVFATDIFLQGGTYPSTFHLTGNAFPGGCPIGSQYGSSGGMFRDNLIYGGSSKCDPSDTTTSLAASGVFTNPGGGDYTLKAGSPAINAGPTTTGDYAPTDKNGVTRPCGAAPDVGAYESCP